MQAGIRTSPEVARKVYSLVAKGGLDCCAESLPGGKLRQRT